MRRARIRLSSQLVEQSLHMPLGSLIIDASYDGDNDWVVLTVQSPELADIDGEPPFVEPTIYRESFRWDWNQK